MAALVAAGAAVTSTDIDLLSVSGLEAARIGDLLAEEGLRLHELAPHRVSLEEAFMDPTRRGRVRGGRPVSRAGLPHALRAEWIKIRSVRSTAGRCWPASG